MVMLFLWLGAMVILFWLILILYIIQAVYTPMVNVLTYGGVLLLFNDICSLLLSLYSVVLLVVSGSIRMYGTKLLCMVRKTQGTKILFHVSCVYTAPRQYYRYYR